MEQSQHKEADKIDNFKNDIISNRDRRKKKTTYSNNDISIEPTYESIKEKNEIVINIDNSDEERIERCKERPKYKPVEKIDKNTQTDTSVLENNKFLSQSQNFLGKKTHNIRQEKNDEINQNKKKVFDVVKIPHNFNNNRNNILENEMLENNIQKKHYINNRRNNREKVFNINSIKAYRIYVSPVNSIYEGNEDIKNVGLEFQNFL